MSIDAPAGRGKIDSPSASRSPTSGASAAATVVSAAGPLNDPASTSGTSAGVACSYTSIAGFSSLIEVK